MSLIRENGKIIYTNNKKSHVGPITLQFSEENFDDFYHPFENILQERFFQVGRR